MLPISFVFEDNPASSGDAYVNDTGVPNIIAPSKVPGPAPVASAQHLGGANGEAVQGCPSGDQAPRGCLLTSKEAYSGAGSSLDRPGRDTRKRRPARVPTECGDLPFLIRRDGTWLYRGTPINRKELVCLFASVLRREADGSWWLQTPAERGRIEVEDAPFVAVELDWAGEGQHQVLSFRTNVDEIVTAGPEHPIRISHDIITCEPTPYILVRPGAAGHLGVEARINRATYYELVALAVPRWLGSRRVLGVWSEGQFFSLGDLPPGEG
jgi:hypothetical protein